MDQALPHSCNRHPLLIPRGDRWQIYRRLRELEIPCACPEDGGFEVEVNNPVAAVQVWSVIQHHTAARQQLVQWLESCW